MVDLELRLLYLGHDGAQIALLTGALDAGGIPYIQKRDFGLQSQAPAVFFSPGTELKLYVAQGNWDEACDLARLVLGAEWEPPAGES